VASESDSPAVLAEGVCRIQFDRGLATEISAHCAREVAGVVLRNLHVPQPDFPNGQHLDLAPDYKGSALQRTSAKLSADLGLTPRVRSTFPGDALLPHQRLVLASSTIDYTATNRPVRGRSLGRWSPQIRPLAGRENHGN